MRDTLIVAGLVAALGTAPVFAQTAAPATAAPATTSAPTQGAAQPAPAAPATPATAPSITAGAAIVDATGAAVGTVAQVDGATIVVDTGTNKVGVPAGNFSQGTSGLVLGNTKAQLDAAATQAAAASQAQVRAQLTPGANVHGVNGKALGKVKTVDGEFVTTTSTSGVDVRLPLSGFAVTPAGLTIGMSQADFDAAVAATRK